MILVNISEAHQATSHPPVIQDQVGVVSGGIKWDMMGTCFFTSLFHLYTH